MTPEQIEEIKKQKTKLLELISPAIKQFTQETGTNPNISISTKSMDTKCGTVQLDSEIHIACWV